MKKYILFIILIVLFAIIIYKVINYPEFKAQIIPQKIQNEMLGVSFKENKYIKIEDLRYLSLTYYGFDNKRHIGHMVVNKLVANEVLDIFKVLYKNKYKIEKIKIIDKYKASDELSMKNNNSSSFCYRLKTNGKGVSKHGLGLAIDINPVQNPYIRKGVVLPIEGKKYVDRNKIKTGMILKNDVCYNAFINKGWEWGGDWKTMKDYQHFEKNLDLIHK